MRKILLFMIILVFALFNVLAAELEIEKIDQGPVIVLELENAAVFDFIINNLGENDTFEIYSLVSVAMFPKGFFELPHGTTEMTVWAKPAKELRKDTGFLSFEYQIRGRKSGIFKDKLLVEIVSFVDVIEVKAEPLYPDDSSVSLIIKNKENTHLDNVQIEFDSIFFNDVKTVSLEPYEEINLSVLLNKKFSDTTAGAYIVFASLAGNEETKVEGVVDYLEKEVIVDEKSSEGFIVRETTFRKTNEGNIPTEVSIKVKKDIVSRLFTVNSPEALTIERKGLFVTYTWKRELRPGESLEIKSKTNYTFPFILVVLVVVIGAIVWVYGQKTLVLKKKVAFIKTKQGEFALKVALRVKARKHVNNVQIIDKIPAMTKLYDKFGRKPDRIDKDTRRLFWNIRRMAKGEVRVYSYIIYSKFNVVGRFELPQGLAIFETDGKTREIWSNKAYFASEMRD